MISVVVQSVWRFCTSPRNPSFFADHYCVFGLNLKLFFSFINKDIFFNYYLTHHVWIVSFADSVLKSEKQRAMKPKERGQGQREGNVATRLYHVKVWGKTYYVDKSPKVWVIAGQCSRDSKSSTSRWQMAVLGQKRLWFGRIMVAIRSYYRHCLLIISGKLWRPIHTMLFWLTCPHWLSPLEMSHKLS